MGHVVNEILQCFLVGEVFTATTHDASAAGRMDRTNFRSGTSRLQTRHVRKRALPVPTQHRIREQRVEHVTDATVLEAEVRITDVLRQSAWKRKTNFRFCRKARFDWSSA